MRILKYQIIYFNILLLGSCNSTITEPKNTLPVIHKITIDSETPLINEIIKLTSYASDDDKHELYYRWSVSKGALTINGIGNPIYWSTPNSAGNVTIVSIVYDGIDMVTKSIGVNVSDRSEQPPE